jgi:hypothetical protein
MREDVLARHPLVAACVLSAALWTSFFLLLEPRYATNDDPLIAMLAAGTGFASTPDEHLVFTNVLIGLALKRLHAASPGLPWYALYLLATHVVAQTVLLYAALRASPRWTTGALYVAYFAVAAVPFANNLQFTVTAFVAAQSGFLLAIGLLERPLGRAPALVGLALAVFGSLIRFEAFALALVLAVPAALVAGWRAARPAALRVAAVLAVSLVLALGARAFDEAYYERAADWSAYREFNRALAQFVDFERANDYTPETATAFRAVGWSRNDHRLLLHWFHPEGDVFDTRTLRAILAQPLPPASSPWARLRAGLRRIVRNRPAQPILLALPLAVLAGGAVWRSRRVVVAGLATSAAALAYVIVLLKAPPHVYLPILAWPLALALVLSRAPCSGRAVRVGLGLAMALAGAGAARAVLLQRAESVEGAVREQEYARGLDAMRGAPERFYVLWSTFPHHVANPLAGEGTLPHQRFVALGWPQRTPAAARTLSGFGYRDLVAALSDPRARLVAPPEAAPWVEQYARRHRAVELHLEPEATVPGFSVFRGAAPAAGPAAERVLRSPPAARE